MMAGPKVSAAVAVVIAATIVTAIVMMGTPAEQRARRLDENRIRDLEEFAQVIDLHYREHGRVPEDVAALADRPGWVLPSDPGTRNPYSYTPTGPRRYRLCAVFSTDTAQRSGEAPRALAVPEWAHPAGPHCFEREVARATK